MTTARITYDGNNIDFAYGVQKYTVTNRQEMNQRFAASGVSEQINLYGITELTLQLFFTASVKRQLDTWWWSWAREGGQFSFALDSANTSNTTLDGPVSGGSVVPLTATTGFAADDFALVIADGDNEREAIQIDYITAGASITATAVLAQVFASGDVCRHLDYYPALISADSNFKPAAQGGGDFYTATFNWFEVLS